MRQIPLTRGKFALVDDGDFDCLNQFKWHAQKDYSVKFDRYYATRTVSKEGSKVLMHRVLVSAPKGLEVDHINGNGLDNRRENIRLCSHTQNQRNMRKAYGKSSKYKGVSRFDNRWKATLCFNRRIIHLGLFNTEKEAADAYDEAAIKFFGAFSYTNKMAI